MSLGPCLCLGTVQSRANEVQSADDGDNGQNETLGAELAQSMALVYVVPFRVRARGRDRSTVGETSSASLERQRSGFRRFREVGEVWNSSC